MFSDGSTPADNYGRDNADGSSKRTARSLPNLPRAARRREHPAVRAGPGKPAASSAGLSHRVVARARPRTPPGHRGRSRTREAGLRAQLGTHAQHVFTPTPRTPPHSSSQRRLTVSTAASRGSSGETPVAVRSTAAAGAGQGKAAQQGGQEPLSSSFASPIGPFQGCRHRDTRGSECRRLRAPRSRSFTARWKCTSRQRLGTEAVRVEERLVRGSAGGKYFVVTCGQTDICHRDGVTEVGRTRRKKKRAFSKASLIQRMKPHADR